MGEIMVINNRQKRGIYQNLVDRGAYRLSPFHENE